MARTCSVTSSSFVELRSMAFNCISKCDVMRASFFKFASALSRPCSCWVKVLAECINIWNYATFYFTENKHCKKISFAKTCSRNMQSAPFEKVRSKSREFRAEWFTKRGLMSSVDRYIIRSIFPKFNTDHCIDMFDISEHVCINWVALSLRN